MAKKKTGEKLLGTGMARKTATTLINRHKQIEAIVSGTTPKKKKK